MTNEEARKYILANWFDGDDSSKYCTDGCEEVMAMKKADEALEKQIAKEPNDYYVEATIIGFTHHWECPNCGGSHICDFRQDCCSRCGQAIDWSDYDE